MDLKLEYSSKSLSAEKAGALVVLVPEETDWSLCGAKELPEDVQNVLESVRKLKVFSGKKGTTHHVVTGNGNWPQVLLVGLGDRKELTAEALRRAAGKVGRLIPSLKSTTAALILSGSLEHVTTHALGMVLAEGLGLGAYEYTEFKSSENGDLPKSVRVKLVDPEKLTDSKSVKAGALRAEATNLARSLGNTPPNVLSPSELAKRAEAMSKRQKLKFRVLDESEMRKLGMHMLLGVGQGAEEPSKLLIMEYRHDKASDTVAIVGKGITFDTGGISLKPSKGMDEMKFDMCGAAAVVGAMQSIAQHKPKVNVIGVVAAAENMPDGKAQRPGDIVKAYNGKTVEVLNTDAEGRLVLGDALAYVVDQFKPTAVLDLATLTGACIVALGHQACGAITNNVELMDKVRVAAEQSGERVWELPNYPEYAESLKGKHGDLRNIGDGDAGTIIGGAFLQHFVGETPWVHLDIAGAAWSVKHVDYHPSGSATGVGVRLLTDLVLNWN
jgi:leucyl aminopeptidase